MGDLGTQLAHAPPFAVRLVPVAILLLVRATRNLQGWCVPIGGTHDTQANTQAFILRVNVPLYLCFRHSVPTGHCRHLS